MKRWVVILGISFFFSTLVSAATSGMSSLFQEANTSYQTGDYAKAAELYEQLIELSPRIPEYYYDLGNAYVRLGKLSQAILNYEKALRFDPRNEDIRHNLKYTRGLLEYRVEDARNWYLKTSDAILRYITQKEIYTVFLVIALVFLVSGILYFLRGRGLFWNAWQRILLILLLIAGTIVFCKHVQNNLIRDAIVMQKECEARYGPSEHDQVAFRMGEGIKVFVMDRREDWSRVLLTNGESGWVKNTDIAEVRV